MSTNIKSSVKESENNEHRVVAPIIVAGNNFEPSVEYKNWWLFTRKKKVEKENIVLNGIFNTYGGGDAVSFFSIIVIEIWGLYNLNLLIDNALLSSGMFVVDALFAILAHIWHKDLLLAKNRLELAKFDIIYLEGIPPKHEKEREKQKISKYEFLTWFFNVLIICLAGFKIFSYIGNNTPDTPFALNLLIILSYIIVAVLHIRSTGYYLCEVIRKFRYNSEYNKHLHTEDSKATIKSHRKFNINQHIQENHEALVLLAEGLGFNQPKPQPVINFRDVIVGQHYIKDNVLVTWGILDDNDLITLINAQATKIQKKYLAIYGLLHQLEILDAPVNTEKNNNDNLLDPLTIPESDSISN
jgi:hypothetical protein